MIEVRTGSDSDLPRIAKLFDSLDELGLKFECEVLSAHRTPELMAERARSLHSRGFCLSIAAAGGAAHLPGMTCSETLLPVIGIPVEGTILRGVDSLYSIVQMPEGIPVATVGVENASGAALFAARILALRDRRIEERLGAARASATHGLANPSKEPSMALIRGHSSQEGELQFKRASETAAQLGIKVLEIDGSVDSERAACEAEIRGAWTILFSVDLDRDPSPKLARAVLATVRPCLLMGFLPKGAVLSALPEENNLCRALGDSSGLPFASSGINRPQNAALLALRICALHDKACASAAARHREELAQSVAAKNARLHALGLRGLIDEIRRG